MKSLMSFSGSDRPYVVQKQLVASSRRMPTNGNFAKKMSLVLTERNPNLGGGRGCCQTTYFILVSTGDPEAVLFAGFLGEVWTSCEKFEEYFLVQIDLCLHKNNLWEPRERCQPIANLPGNGPCPHQA